MAFDKLTLTIKYSAEGNTERFFFKGKLRLALMTLRLLFGASM